MPASRRSTPAQPKTPCPECGSRRAVPIVYGYPTEQLARKAQTGCVILGGCVVSGDDPHFQCKDCDTRFWIVKLES